MAADRENAEADPALHDAGGYLSAFPILPGTIVTISHITTDLTPSRAERLAKIIGMLAVE